ncbi:hypothetical protein B0O99DRAFT_76099 [Bisporella sp. PMI_857]|nr:hypothetical protein B0O99DRAFT_76099 [Bisporella sp. PMI_857]
MHFTFLAATLLACISPLTTHLASASPLGSGGALSTEIENRDSAASFCTPGTLSCNGEDAEWITQCDTSGDFDVKITNCAQFGLYCQLIGEYPYCISSDGKTAPITAGAVLAKQSSDSSSMVLDEIDEDEDGSAYELLNDIGVTLEERKTPIIDPASERLLCWAGHYSCISSTLLAQCKPNGHGWLLIADCSQWGLGCGYINNIPYCLSKGGDGPRLSVHDLLSKNASKAHIEAPQKRDVTAAQPSDELSASVSEPPENHDTPVIRPPSENLSCYPGRYICVNNDFIAQCKPDGHGWVIIVSCKQWGNRCGYINGIPYCFGKPRLPPLSIDEAIAKAKSDAPFVPPETLPSTGSSAPPSESTS